MHHDHGDQGIHLSPTGQPATQASNLLHPAGSSAAHLRTIRLAQLLSAATVQLLPSRANAYTRAPVCLLMLRVCGKPAAGWGMVAKLLKGMA